MVLVLRYREVGTFGWTSRYLWLRGLGPSGLYVHDLKGLVQKYREQY